MNLELSSQNHSFVCNCKSRRVQVPVPTAVYGDGDASRTGREAAGLRSLLPASVCQELVLLPACWTPPRSRHSLGAGRGTPLAARGDTSATRSVQPCAWRAYPELLRAPRCRLVVLAIELAGRWNAEAVQFVRLLSRCRARSAPPQMRASSTAAWVQRWSGFLAFAAARSFAASLLSLPLHGAANVDGSPPDLSDVLAERRLDSPPHPSRLPAR